MSKYEDRITADRVGPPEIAIPDSPAQKPAAAATAGPTRFGRASRRAALAGVAVAAVLGAGYWGTRLLDGGPVRGLDRRRLCAGRQHHDRSQSFGLHRRGARARQRAGEGRPGPRPNRRPRLPRRARPGQGRCRGRARRVGRQAGPARCPALGDRHGPGDRRGRPGQRHLRRTGQSSATRTWRRTGYGSVQNAAGGRRQDRRGPCRRRSRHGRAGRGAKADRPDRRRNSLRRRPPSRTTKPSSARPS